MAVDDNGEKMLKTPITRMASNAASRNPLKNVKSRLVVAAYRESPPNTTTVAAKLIIMGCGPIVTK